MELAAPRDQQSDVEDTHRLIEIPALGRHVELGMLYDRRNDNLTNKKLSKRYIKSTSIKENTFDRIITIIQAADNLRKISQALNISDSLATSIFIGLVKVSGAAAYVHDKHGFDNEARVILHLVSTVKREELRPDIKLADCNFFEHATHLVAGVIYGVQAFFVFSRQRRENESISQVQCDLVEAISKLKACITVGGGKKLPFESNTDYTEIKCQFYGDISSINAVPITFIDAIECLTKLIKKKKKKAVPLSFLLKPWSEFDCRGPIFLSLNSDIHTIIHEMLLGIDCIEVECKGLLKDSLWTEFPRFAKILKSFLDQVLKFKQSFQRRLACEIPKIRSHNKNEQTLVMYLSAIKESPFYLPKLRRWVEYVDKVMNVVKSSLEILMPINIFSLLDSLPNISNSNGNVVCFCFPSVYQQEKHLREMSRYLEIQTFDIVLNERQHQENVEYNSDFESREIAASVSHFKRFMEANNSSTQIKFVGVGFYQADSNGQQRINKAEIRLYENGVLKSFELPGATGKPIIEHKTHDSVTLKWTPPSVGLAHIKTYSVKYKKEYSGHHDWLTSRISTTNFITTIRSLEPHTTYRFAVVADCGVGLSESSPASNMCTTLPSSAPLNVKKAKVSFNSVQVVWETPKQITEELSISHYKIKYHPSSESQESDYNKTDGRNCMHTLDRLTPNTSYGIFVCAVFNNGYESAFSQKVCIETESEEPPVPGVPIVTFKSHNEVILQWSQPVWESARIKRYVLKCRETTGDWVDCYSEDDKTSFKLSGLKPNRSHKFGVCADYGIRSSKTSAISEECTTYAATAPADVRIDMLFTDIMKIKWNPPSYTCVDVKRYKIQYQPASEPDKRHLREEETKDTVCLYTLRNLKPSTTYNISVSALCGDNGESATAEIELGTAAENPPAPGTPCITSKTHNEIRLEWSKPETDKHHIERYVLHYREMSANNDRWKVIETRDQNTSLTLPSLFPNTSYQFKVAADYGVCSGEISTTSITCTTYVATCPTYLRPKMKFRELMQIEWNPPTTICKGYSIAKYRVKYHPSNGTDQNREILEETEGASCIHTLRNLQPNYAYMISLSALFDAGGESSPSDFVEVMTALESLSAPLNPIILSKTHNSVCLTWEQPASDSHNTSNFVVYYRKKRTTWSKWSKCLTAYNSKSETVSGLTANTAYEFSISKDYGICIGEMSAPSEVCMTDAVAAPSHVRKIISVAKLMNIEWNPPSLVSEGHAVQKYKIKYHPTADDTLHGEVETEGPMCLHTLQNLSPNTMYKISVSAVCGDGKESAPSSVFEIATSHTNPPAPGPPELDDKTHNTISLIWTHDINDATHIKSYILTYKEAFSDSWETFNTADSKKSATIQGIKPNTAYEFSVFADYDFFQGDRSVSSDPYMTYAASPPYDVKMYQAFQRNIEVVWNLPTFICEGLIVNRYKIRYQPAHQDGLVNMKESQDDTCSYRIDDLLPNTAYLVSVSAVCSEDVESAYSTAVEMNTLPRIAPQIFKEIQEGPGQIYSTAGLLRVELPLTRSGNALADKYRTYSFGERVSSGKKHIVIMVVGATGAGKSTLINAMVNYIFQVTWEDAFRFQIVPSERESGDLGQPESQTQLISSYSLEPRQGTNLDCTLTIIDTPGFGDTKGINRDKAIVKQIRDFFSESAIKNHCIDHVNAIGLVVQATHAHITATQRYVFDSILGMFWQ